MICLALSYYVTLFDMTQHKASNEPRTEFEQPLWTSKNAISDFYKRNEMCYCIASNKFQKLKQQEARRKAAAETF